MLLVVLLDAAGEDVVVPAVDIEFVVSEGFGDAGLGAQVDELGYDVAADDGGQFGVFAVGRVGGLAVRECALDVLEPAAGFGQVFKAFAVDGGFERSAVGVAAYDGVLYMQDVDGVLDGGGGAIDIVAGDGNDVAGVAADEEVAGAGLENEVGDDAGIRTGDEEILRRLRLGEEMVLRLLVREYVAMKALVAFDEGVDSPLLGIDRFIHNSDLPWIA